MNSNYLDNTALPFSNLEKNLDKICRFLNENKLKATFFWLGWEAARYSHLVRRIHNLGHEIGVHSYYHIRLNDLGKNEFQKNTARAIKILEDITGKKVRAYRAPGLSMNNKTFWAFEVLSELGIGADSSLVTGSFIGKQCVPDHPFIMNYHGVKMQEFPVSSFWLFNHSFNYSGSGYFRITPYWFLRKEFVESPYTMSYFHPRDFDLNIHKMIKRNPYMKLKYRVGTKSAFHKLEKLSEKINWMSLEKASVQMNWEQAKTINLL